LTARQIRYFNITLQASGISAAARSAHLTQPTISLQIQKMEAALGCILLERSSSGVEITSAGRLLAPLASEIEALLNAILSNRRSVAAFTQSAVAIGFLPSSGHDSAMTAQFADALTLLRRNHPECRLTLVEDTNAALHEAIGSGELNLAVVGSVEGSFARVMLGKSEHLSVVANPALGLAGRPNIALSEACALPLVLGPQFLTIHAAFANAAAERRLHINQVIEAGSIPLAISMTRRAPLCTVLPASSVRNDVAAGRLTVTPIAERLSIGNLAVIFSGERELSEIERAAVRALATAF
jgi:DNA-binding transcriptional LysR family regulator